MFLLSHMYTQLADVILRVTNGLLLLPQQLMTSSQLLDKACTRFDYLCWLATPRRLWFQRR